MAKILLTGANGFIGTHLQQALHAQTVVNFTGDVTNSAAWSEYQKIDVVIHLAALTSSRDTAQGPYETYRVNVLGTLNALEFCRTHGARLVLASTNVYGAPKFLPVTEDHPIVPDNPYTHSKFLAEELAREYANFGVHCVILRLTNVYGIGQSEKFLIPSILAGARKVHAGEQDVVHLRSSTSKRDFIYIDDVTRAFVLAAAHNAPGCIALNIGSGVATSVSDVVAILQSAGGQFPVVYAETPEGVPEICFSAERAAHVLSWKPLVSLRDGLSRVAIGAAGR